MIEMSYLFQLEIIFTSLWKSCHPFLTNNSKSSFFANFLSKLPPLFIYFHFHQNNSLTCVAGAPDVCRLSPCCALAFSRGQLCALERDDIPRQLVADLNTYCCCCDSITTTDGGCCYCCFCCNLATAPGGWNVVDVRGCWVQWAAVCCAYVY